MTHRIMEELNTKYEILNTKRPSWIRGRASWGPGFGQVKTTLKGLKLHTVCEEAACPNKGECWEKKHATFMILGKICTRGCSFCNVGEGILEVPDKTEPDNIAKAVEELGIKYAVITSVTRDDLPDKGAGQFVKTVKAVKRICPDTVLELLIPDLGADNDLLGKVFSAGAEVIGHNLEMPENMYAEIRPRSDYARSLKTLRILDRTRRGSKVLLKSALIIGMGEDKEDIFRTLEDLKGAGTDIVFLGQYLTPSAKHWPVARFYTPEEFADIGTRAMDLGFKAVHAGPMVRSSYRAVEAYREALEASNEG